MRDLPHVGCVGDDGAASPALVAALAAYDDDPATRHTEALATLQHERLLVPVVPVPGESDAGGGEKTSDMATVLMRGRDGRTALLAFTSTDALSRWDAVARPVPVPAGTAAAAAVQDGASALVVDVAGPVLFVVEGDDLQQLARGSVLVRVSDRYGWVRPDR